MITEGTYPFTVGGVSTCCHELTNGIPDVSWDVLPLITPTRRSRADFAMPPNARVLPPIVVWDEQATLRFTRHDAPGGWVPATLLRGLLGWRGDVDAATDALVWCRRHPRLVSRAFASGSAWAGWHEALDDLSREDDPAAVTCTTSVGGVGLEATRATHWMVR